MPGAATPRAAPPMGRGDPGGAAAAAGRWSAFGPIPTVKAHDREMDQLYAKASRAYTDGRFADAAEYARHAVLAGPESPLRSELLCLRGESLLRVGRALEAAEAFEEVLQGPPNGPYVPQALFSAAEARQAAGDQAGAERAPEAPARGVRAARHGPSGSRSGREALRDRGHPWMDQSPPEPESPASRRGARSSSSVARWRAISASPSSSTGISRT